MGEPAQDDALGARRHGLAAVAACVLAAVAVVGGATLWMKATGNLHSLHSDQLYRSAQPDEERLRGWIDELGLKSVVSLRGANPGADWYRMEQAVTAERGIEFRTVRLSGDRMPAPQDLSELAGLIDSLERPALLHCLQGVERSGLGGAVAVLLAGGSVDDARAQFGLRFGFHPWLARSNLPLVVEDYAAWLAREGVEHSADRFRSWITTDYVPAFYKAELEIVSLPDGARMGEPGTVEVRAINRSPRPWHFSADRLSDIHLVVSARAVEADHHYKRQRAGYFDRTVAPGESIALQVDLLPFEHAGPHELTVELVDEYVAWFRDMGSPGVTVQFQVQRSTS